MTEVEQAAESLTSTDGAVDVNGGRQRRLRDEPIADTLVGSFEVIVLDEIGYEQPEMSLSERDDAAETLAADGADEALGVTEQP